LAWGRFLLLPLPIPPQLTQYYSLLLVFNGVFTFLVQAYPLYGASALGAAVFSRCVFAAVFPLFGGSMYHRLGTPWATTLLGFLALGMMPFPYLFFIYGKRLRKQSVFASERL
jgi:hypothetical protein